MSIYKMTVTVSDLRSPKGNEILKEVQGTDMIRITHRLQPMRVVMTEDLFMKFAAAAPHLLANGDELGVSKPSAEEFKKRGRELAEKIDFEEAE